MIHISENGKMKNGVGYAKNIWKLGRKKKEETKESNKNINMPNDLVYSTPTLLFPA